MPDEDVTAEAGKLNPDAELPKGLQPHDYDRGLDLRLHSNGTAEPRGIEIREPSIRMLGKLQAAFADVDKKAPKLPDDQTDPKWVAALDKRRAWIYGGTDGESFPYGDAVAAAIKLCSNIDVTIDDLPSWCANPLVAQSMMNHFTLPLVGPVGQSE